MRVRPSAGEASAAHLHHDSLGALDGRMALAGRLHLERLREVLRVRRHHRREFGARALCSGGRWVRR
eukprot:431209-Prymnesium_polylepis.1